MKPVLPVEYPSFFEHIPQVNVSIKKIRIKSNCLFWSRKKETVYFSEKPSPF